MANNFQGQVWYIDTPMTGEDPTWKNCNVYVYALNWAGMQNGADLVVTDRNGRIIYNAIAGAQDAVINLPHLGWVQGVIVSTLTSGNVTIMVNK